MENQKQAEGKFQYDKDTKGYHRFRIISPDGIEGTIYIPRDFEPIPDRLVLDYENLTADQAAEKDRR